MADFSYTTNPARIRLLFDKIKSSGIPDKVTQKILEAWGLKSKNDRPLLTILKSIGFVDSSGTPTDHWAAFRGASGPAVLAQAIRSSYSSLFQLYPDAHQKDNEALRNFFSTHTSVGAGTLNFMVGTFRALCDIADFQVGPVEIPSAEATSARAKLAEPAARAVSVPSSSGFTINVNIQLTLPATDNPAIYENLFAAMKKHILS